VAGSLILHGRTVRNFLPWVERLVYFSKLPRSLLTPPKKTAAPAASELVQITGSLTVAAREEAHSVTEPRP
jgi:hypothetical protein